MKTLMAVLVCLSAFSLTLVLSSLMILAIGGAKVFLLQAVFKPLVSSVVGTLIVERAIRPINHIHFYALCMAIILFVGYLQVGRQDVFTPYNIASTASFIITAIGSSYLVISYIRGVRSESS